MPLERKALKSIVEHGSVTEKEEYMKNKGEPRRFKVIGKLSSWEIPVTSSRVLYIQLYGRMADGEKDHIS
jgi:hypothetical protein